MERVHPNSHPLFPCSEFPFPANGVQLANVSCEVNSVKRWPWSKILVIVSSLLILVGITPISYLFWFGYAHNWNPMTMPLPLAMGTYSSPYFTTDLDKPYYLVVVSDRILDGQSASCIEGAKVIDSHACAGVGRLLDLDWEIVNEHGTVMQQGTYNDRIYSGEEVRLGEYLAKLGSHLGVRLRIHQDIRGFQSAYPKLEFQPDPEYGLENSYGFAVFAFWACIVSGPGVLILLGLLVRPFVRKKVSIRPDVG